MLGGDQILADYHSGTLVACLQDWDQGRGGPDQNLPPPRPGDALGAGGRHRNQAPGRLWSRQASVGCWDSTTLFTGWTAAAQEAFALWDHQIQLGLSNLQDNTFAGYPEIAGSGSRPCTACTGALAFRDRSQHSHTGFLTYIAWLPTTSQFWVRHQQLLDGPFRNTQTQAGPLPGPLSVGTA